MSLARTPLLHVWLTKLSGIKLCLQNPGQSPIQTSEHVRALKEGQQVQELTPDVAAENQELMTKVMEALRGTLGPR